MKTTDLELFVGTPSSGDFIEFVDISDTTHSAEGTSKRIAYEDFFPAADTTTPGITSFATEAEAEAGDESAKAISPAVLKAIDSLTEYEWFLDEDDMASDSDTKVASQQSVKAYVDRDVFQTLNIHPLFSPQGFLINGKISVTDASGITVAIKTLAGTDPSASDPVYVRIGDTIRSITSALTVSKADGTNWFNSGGAELAAREVDYFVYLGYNATDGVVIGFSRIPWAGKYGDFSATPENESYCAISTITTAASTDYYEVIGRFAATLSAGAGYTWSVPAYTALNLIQRPIYATRWLTWLPTYTGFSSAPTGGQRYRIDRETLSVIMSDAGTSNSATFDFTLPFTPASLFTLIPAHVLDNGTGVDTGVLGFSVGGATRTIKVGKTQSTRSGNAFAGFTGSGSKGYDGAFSVPLAFL